MDSTSDPLAALDFKPQCAWAETSATKRCTGVARYGYVWTCGCASVYCGEHDAQVQRSVTIASGTMVRCPIHGPVRRYSREPLAVTP